MTSGGRAATLTRGPERFCIYTVPVPHRHMFVRSSCGWCTDGHWTSLDAFNQHINNGNEESDPQYPAPRVDPDVTAFFVKSIPSGFRQELNPGEVSTNVEVEEYNVSEAEGVELSIAYLQVHDAEGSILSGWEIHALVRMEPDPSLPSSSMVASAGASYAMAMLRRLAHPFVKKIQPPTTSYERPFIHRQIFVVKMCQSESTKRLQPVNIVGKVEFWIYNIFFNVY
ncbi:hypothetical protein B0H11DRAFT_1916526 [Mycena galericulata]|nr:hypothetical protein B0H11DRAFT_1916526 [Mycena galericulata]